MDRIDEYDGYLSDYDEDEGYWDEEDEQEETQEILYGTVVEFGEYTLKQLLQSGMVSGYSKEQKEHLQNNISTFIGMMYEYVKEMPNQWTPQSVEMLLKEVFPFKLATEYESIETLPENLATYFSFLEKTGYLKNAQELINGVNKSKTQLLKRQKLEASSNSNLK